MLMDLFLAPGRFLGKAFSREKKRSYRSLRGPSGLGFGVVLASLASWLVLAGLALYAVDKAGLLKQALDVGVEVATTGEKPGEPPPAAPPDVRNGAEASSATAAGALPERNGSGSTVPSNGLPVTAGAPAPAAEAELWLVILHTIPKVSREEAERRQSQYASRGLKVEILDTDAFPRLKSGNWIIAQGPFDDKASALAASEKAKAFNAGLIVRRGL